MDSLLIYWSLLGLSIRHEVNETELVFQDQQSLNFSSIFCQKSAKFEPSDAVFTRTVNAGDRGITIVMTAISEPNDPENAITWRKDGGNRISSGEGSLTLTLSDPIQSSDEGIYEIHYYIERSAGQGALYRIIVRGNRHHSRIMPRMYTLLLELGLQYKTTIN